MSIKWKYLVAGGDEIDSEDNHLMGVSTLFEDAVVQDHYLANSSVREKTREGLPIDIAATKKKGNSNSQNNILFFLVTSIILPIILIQLYDNLISRGQRRCIY